MATTLRVRWPIDTETLLLCVAITLSYADQYASITQDKSG